MPEPKPQPGELVTPGRQGHWIVSKAAQYEERAEPFEVVCDGFTHTVYAPDGKTVLGETKTRGKALELIRLGPPQTQKVSRTSKPGAPE